MSRMKKMAVMFTVAAALSLACGPPKAIHVDEMKDPGLGMIYGQIRLPHEDWLMNLVMIQRVGKVYAGMGLRGVSEKVQTTRDGRFVAANLKPGKYMLAGFVIGSERDFLGKAALNYTVDVKPGGIHYLGTYGYVIVKAANMVRPGTFDLEPDQRRSSHAELLTWVEEATRGTKWHAAVNRRFGETQKNISTGK